MAMVDSFGRIRSELSTFDPVDEDSVRSAAMAAALAEFDARADAAVALPAAAAVDLPLPSRRHRGYRVLTGVAAAVVIAVVGIAALNSTKGNDENSSAGVAPAATATPPQLKIASDTAASAAPTAANNAAGAGVGRRGGSGRRNLDREHHHDNLPEINGEAGAAGVREQLPDRHRRAHRRCDSNHSRAEPVAQRADQPGMGSGVTFRELARRDAVGQRFLDPAFLCPVELDGHRARLRFTIGPAPQLFIQSPTPGADFASWAVTPE